MQNIWKKETKATIDPSRSGSIDIWGISLLSFLWHILAVIVFVYYV